ncbi:holo-ACP synthase [Anaerofustis stercorihominis]|uniref:Holo-[acyl-carrier-protein] synthase n=1 Tax=Anaerofustis stercorihominis DSM 17244 TaxID=445971 RepID=B1CB26_9FIRM|nr:holo-ACP synthase [Anaerofustis stercorihominis]EDS71473.1 holo-[acyl-carrier-protein] synthase [Anaerofustis stercorihominis DSM 17244]MCQ4795424.1 holo-ACP synthase [Anaerofustis stercorihominis]
MVDKKALSNGVDIVKVKRIKKILMGTHKDLFLRKIFNKEEIFYFEHNNYNPKSVSGYFAAKEAIMKTLGKGMDKLSFKDITILKTRDNKPYVKLSGKAEDYMESLGLTDFKISISHEDEYAVAFVIAV